jgi:NH3-dependent NAD+ synthetase
MTIVRIALAQINTTVGDLAANERKILAYISRAQKRGVDIVAFPDQKDEDSLPPYSVLDPILQAYVEEDRDWEEIVAMGFDPGTVAEVIQMVDRTEYKRRQAPPGVRITQRAFGKDRRLPITNRYRDGRP